MSNPYFLRQLAVPVSCGATAWQTFDVLINKTLSVFQQLSLIETGAAEIASMQ
jgi:hypothetical protein